MNEDHLIKFSEQIAALSGKIEVINSKNEGLSEGIEKIFQILHTYTEDLQDLTRKTWELEQVTKTIESIKGFQTEIKERFIIMDKERKQKDTIFIYFSKHWWKILAVILAIVIPLGELMVYLRNLPPIN